MKSIVKKIIKLNIFLLLSIGLVFLTGCLSFQRIDDNDNLEYRIKVGEVIDIDISGAVSFTSTDDKIACVDKNGIVTGLSVGKCKINVSTSTKEYEVSITVIENEKTVQIVYDCKQTLKVDEKVNIKASVVNSTDAFVLSYQSSDTSVATVSTDGEITGVGVGICIITIKATGTVTVTKDLFIYVNQETSSTTQTNVIENKSYEITGSFDLTSLSNKIINIVDAYKDSIVGVSNYQNVQVSFSQKQLIEASVGTGFIFKKENTNGGYKYYVLTNHHVVEDAVKLKIYFGYDDEYIDCELVNSSENLDIAVVTFTSNKVYTLLEFGSVNDVHEGDFAVAIGNSNGYEYFGSVTFGIISYVNRTLSGEDAIFLQHDVAINPGNSGGPLFDINGKVIGINTLKIVESDVDNMGFSISIETVKSYLETLGL